MKTVNMILTKNIDGIIYKLLVASSPSLIKTKDGKTLTKVLNEIKDALDNVYTKKEIEDMISEITGGKAVLTEDAVNKLIMAYVSEAEDAGLNTDDKTIIGAINELKNSSSSISEDEINKLIAKYSLEVEDENLNTENKTIISAINELHDNSSSINENDINNIVDKYVTTKEVSTLKSANKTIEGAINEVVTRLSDTIDEDTVKELINDSFDTVEKDELKTTNKTIVSAINEVFQSVSKGKEIIASAITDRGVLTSSDATFSEMGENIINIPEPEILSKLRISNIVSGIKTSVSYSNKVSNNVTLKSDTYEYHNAELSNPVTLTVANYTTKESE